MNFFDLITSLCYTTGVTSTPPTTFDSSDDETFKYKQYLNQANSDIIKKLPWNFRNKTLNFSTVIGRVEYTRPTGTIKKVYYDGKELRFIEDENLLDTATGAPTGYYINHETNMIGIYNAPDAVYSVDIKYITNYQAMDALLTLKSSMTLETDTSIIPIDYQDLIVMGAEIIFIRDKQNRSQSQAQINYNNRLDELITYDRGTLEATPSISAY